MMDQEEYKQVVGRIRSGEKNMIPKLIYMAMKNRDHKLTQLILLIYNLNTPEEEPKFEKLTATNQLLVLRRCLRLYLSVEAPTNEELTYLVKITTLSHDKPELLIELAYVFHETDKKLAEDLKPLVEEGLEKVMASARSGLYPDALLMMYSIKGLREQEASVN